MTDTPWLTWMLDQSWFYAGVLLILVFPLVVIALGELIQRLPPGRSEWSRVLKNLQHQIIPQLVFLLILTKIMGYDRSNIAVKVVETFLWVFVIHTTLGIANLLLFSHAEDRHDWRARIPKLVLDFTRAFLVLIGTALVLAYVWDLPLAKLLTALGVGSIVLGLALQDTLSSLFSGFALLTSRQFRINDWLSLPDDRIGKVISMNWRTVTLLTRDEDILIVPNSDLAKSTYTNFSHPYPRHMERVLFDFSFDDAPYKVKDAMIEAALATPGVLSDPYPSVALISYDEFSVRHEVQYFIEHYSDQPRIRNDFMSRVWYVAKRHGITFPTRAHEVVMMPSPADSDSQSEDVDISLLRRFPFLERRTTGLEDIAQHSHLLEYGRGEVILRQSEISTSLYLILEGSAEETHIDKTGHLHRINKLFNGDFFGLASMIRQEGSNISVTATTDLVVIAVSEAATHRLMDRYPDLADEMEHIIEKRLREVGNLDAKSERALTSDDDHENKNSGNIIDMKTFINN
jgi:small-conductance mechanosensitive channel